MRNWLVLLFGILCISVSAVFVRLSQVNGIVSAFYRIAFALLFIAPIWLVRRRRIDASSAALCLLGGAFFGLELACWNLSIGYLNATVPTVLVNLSTIWVSIGAMLIYEERSSAFHWIGMCVALAGIVVLIGIDKLIRLSIGSGVFLAIGASFFLAFYTLTIKKVRARIDTITILFFALIGSLLPLSILALLKGLPLAGFSIGSWLCMAELGIVVQVGGYFSINYVLKYLSPIKVSLLTLLQPIITAILSMLILGEVITRRLVLGGIIVIGGLGLSFIRTGKGERAPLPHSAGSR